MARVSRQHEDSQKIAIAAVGSTMFQTRVRNVPDPGFHSLIDIIRGADAAFLNLEAPIREPTAHAVKQHVYTSYATSEPWVVEELHWAGFNLVSLANNHMSDWSGESIATNRRLLATSGIAFSGAGPTLSDARAPGYLDTPRGRVGLISVDSSFEYGQFFHVQMASDPHGGVPARPGTNGLRWDTYYELEDQAFDDLRRVHRSLGLDREGIETSHLADHQAALDRFWFRGVVVHRARSTRIRTVCRERDLTSILKWIRSTRAQVDCLIVSHHNHQAAGDEWELPVDFVREFAHGAIDAGADVYVGHGYTSKGVEIYSGRPILYDLGDWSMQDAAARWHPSDAYERWGLEPGATPGELADAREAARRYARHSIENRDFRETVDRYQRAVGQSALARLVFSRGTLEAVELHPCVPMEHGSRHHRNLPTLARGETGAAVLARFARASESLGTKIEVRNGVGHVRLG